MIGAGKWHGWWGENVDGKREGRRTLGRCGADGKITLKSLKAMGWCGVEFVPLAQKRNK